MFSFYHDLAIAAIIKDEAPYLWEWLTYHQVAGVTKFFLYDNGSTDGSREIMQKFVARGGGELIDCPLEAAQMYVYQDAIGRSRFHCKYLAIIDVDEFLLPIDGKALPMSVESLLQVFPNAAGVAAPWRFFGSAGEENYKAEEVTKRFCWRAPDDFSPHNQIKSIFNPRLVSFMQTPHNAFFWGDRGVITGDGKYVSGAFLNHGQWASIFTCHYFVKSKEEFMKKCARGTADGTVGRTEDDFSYYDRNDVFADSAWQYFKKWRSRPYPHKKKAEIDRKNYLRLQEIQGGGNASLTELLCHFFNYRNYALGKDEAEVRQLLGRMASLLYERLSNDVPVQLEEVLLLAATLPDLIGILQLLPNWGAFNWQSAMNNILMSGSYEARKKYRSHEICALEYARKMITVIMRGGIM